MDKVYISFQKSSEVSNRKITIGDIASVYCKDNSIQAKIKSLPIINTLGNNPNDRGRRNRKQKICGNSNKSVFCN